MQGETPPRTAPGEAYPFLIVDVFTRHSLEGNPCAVVLEAEGLDDTRMQALARETNLSETAFVSPDSAGRNSFRGRYFTPETEVPFAGHPTLATVRALVDAGHGRSPLAARPARRAALRGRAGTLDGTSRAGLRRRPGLSIQTSASPDRGLSSDGGPGHTQPVRPMALHGSRSCKVKEPEPLPLVREMDTEEVDPADVKQVRRFNRTVTQRIGALNDHFMSRDRPLGEARVLWEIGGDDGTTVRELRKRLELDAGCLSRLLRSLEEDGMAVVEPHPDDGRVRVARLTEAGRRERDVLDRLSDDLARSFLSPLSASQQGPLVEAMKTVERLLTAGLVTFQIADPTSDDARYCIDAYFDELDDRFEDGFDPDRSISADADELTEPDGLLLLARLHGEPVGCGALKFHDDDPAEIKRMWVDPSARGLGLGRRLLEELEEEARVRGVTKVRLETNRTLTEAIRLYRSAGYEEVEPFNDEPYAHHWFEKELDSVSRGGA